MFIPTAGSFKALRVLNAQMSSSSIGSMLINFVSPAIKEAPAPSQPVYTPSSKPNFDLTKVVVEQAQTNVADDIQTFLHTHYFQNQPVIANLTKPLDRNFLDILAERYSTTGDRWLAYQMEPRMRMRRIVGALVGYKKFPWEAERLEEWALRNPNPERYLAYFYAHCYRSADLFNKYKIPYIYDIELLATSGKLKSCGIEDLLLRTAFQSIIERNHFPLVQIIATNHHVNEASARAHMMHEWSTSLSTIGDEHGMCIFDSKYPDYDQMATADIYTRLLTPKSPNKNNRLSNQRLR